ncbi:MAG: glycosyltransferase family 9 protein, partial [bacterium]
MHEPAGKKILILRTDRLGDVLLSTPVAGALKKHFPRSQLTFLVRQYTQPIAESCVHIDETMNIETFFNSYRKTRVIKLTRFFREQKFDIAIHLFPRPELALATFLARIPIRVGTGYRFYSLLFNKRQYEHRKNASFHEAEYNLRLLRQLGIYENAVSFEIELEQTAKEKVNRILTSAGISRRQPIVVLHPGSGGSAR